MSKYRYTYPNGHQWCGSEAIIPYSYEEARAWAEEKLDADEYEKLFGEVEEDDSQVQTCNSIKKKCFDDIKLNSAAYNSQVHRRALAGSSVDFFVFLPCMPFLYRLSELL